MSKQNSKEKQIFAPPPTLFVSENFKKFNENDFIENLTYRLLNETKRPTKSYSDYCHAFEQLFELSLKELNRLKLDEKEQSEKSISETAETEKMHMEKLKNLMDDIEPISEKLKSLEDDINKVGNSTVQIGNNLEAIDNQKKRAIEADKLIRYISEFNKYDPQTFDQILLPIEAPERTNNDQLLFKIFTKKSKKGAAKKIKQLDIIMKDLQKVPSCAKAVENIRKYSDSLLKILSDNFVKALKLLDVDRSIAYEKLKRRANVMFDFNGGEKCIELFILERFESFLKGQSKAEQREENPEFSGDSEPEAPEEYDLEENPRLPKREVKKLEPKKKKQESESDSDSDSEEEERKKKKKEEENKPPPPPPDPREELKISVRNEEQFKDFLGSVEDIIQKEYITIENIFPSTHCVEVLKRFMLKIINEVIAYIVDYLAIEPQSILGTNGNDLLGQYLKSVQTIYRFCMGFCKRIITKVPLTEKTLIPMMEAIFTDRKKKYIELEMKHTKAISKLIIDQLELEELKASGTQYSGKEKEILGKLSGHLTGDLGKDIPTLFNPSNFASQFNLITETTVGIIDTLKSEKKDIYEQELLKLDFVINLIHENADALERCIDLTEKEKLEVHMFKILKVLFHIISKYVNRAFDQVLMNMTQWKPYVKTPPPTQLFKVVQLGSSILHNLERHLEIKVIPIVSSSIQIRIECTRLRDDLFVPVESKVAKGLDQHLILVMEHLRYIFDYEQKSADYNRREQDYHLDNEATAACLKCCAELKNQYRVINQTLYGKNREYFLGELGTQFYRLLIKNLNKMVVSTIGAIRLMRDLKEYQKLIRDFDILAVEELFDSLRDISNLFIVPSENLENVLSELEKNKSKDELFSFVKMREDFSKKKLAKLPFFEPKKK